jgi:hypothetical protein
VTVTRLAPPASGLAEALQVLQVLRTTRGALHCSQVLESANADLRVSEPNRKGLGRELGVRPLRLDAEARFSGVASGTMSISWVARRNPCTPTATPPMTTKSTCAFVRATSRSSGANMAGRAVAQLAYEAAQTQRLLETLLRRLLAVARTSRASDSLVASDLLGCPRPVWPRVCWHGENCRVASVAVREDACMLCSSLLGEQRDGVEEHGRERRSRVYHEQIERNR